MFRKACAAMPCYVKAPSERESRAPGLLYQVLKADTPETRLMRKGLLRYWKHSPSGRAATMGLLSTHETRLFVMLREYIHVCGYSLPELGSCDSRTLTLARLSRSLFRFVSQNIRWF